MRQDILKRFLTKTGETGRFLMKSRITVLGISLSQFIMGKLKKWGDLNPATGQIEGDYGSKYKGAVPKKESLITQENGFVNIGYFKGSPFGAIEVRDREHQKRLGLL